MTIVLIVIGLLILAVIIGFAIFWNHNENWFKKNLAEIKRVGAVEKQIKLPNGNVINYGEVKNDKPALLLIHGQMAAWEDYAPLLAELSEKWHIFAIDLYGHGQSSHKEDIYYLDVNGNDLIWFIDNVIGEKTVVSGHSNGAITAAYIGAFGGENISGVILEDPPIFSVEGEGWEESFAYLDTYKNLHDYNQSDKSECWEEYYLRRCLWGKLFMGKSINKVANYAHKYHHKHPGQAVRIGFLPPSMWLTFEYVSDYDFTYGERFYDTS